MGSYSLWFPTEPATCLHLLACKQRYESDHLSWQDCGCFPGVQCSEQPRTAGSALRISSSFSSLNSAAFCPPWCSKIHSLTLRYSWAPQHGRKMLWAHRRWCRMEMCARPPRGKDHKSIMQKLKCHLGAHSWKRLKAEGKEKRHLKQSLAISNLLSTELLLEHKIKDFKTLNKTVYTELKRRLFYVRSDEVFTIKNLVEFLKSWACIETALRKQNPHDL